MEVLILSAYSIVHNIVILTVPTRLSIARITIGTVNQMPRQFFRQDLNFTCQDRAFDNGITSTTRTRIIQID
ncbi:hypothetical protein Y032_0031g2401 [Ancylostoma ceylanicum]|uniref:Uncharacterized protein n=1 Tax=Ancylostoma ceylanicum TaxID=53326 RepID=A0A016UPI6_9BILA|nr:hypothetical protein Y032_0031g2401 [Ancylostoma ceylanicum]